MDGNGRRKYLSTAERARFLAAADHEDPPTRALCYLYAFTGCRLSEAIELGMPQLDLGEKTVTIRTLKRRKLTYRAIPVPDEVIRQLISIGESDGRFWQVHRTTAWRRIKRVMARAGIAGTMATTKGLRHGFGILAAEKNVPLNLIQKFLGHASPAMTATYVDAVGQEERQFAARMW